jgi:hypothetical protein
VSDAVRRYFVDVARRHLPWDRVIEPMTDGELRTAARAYFAEARSICDKFPDEIQEAWRIAVAE